MILTTHAGSLPKTRALAKLHAARAAGEAVDEAGFEAHVDDAMAGVIARQIACGVDIVGDGEVGREGFFSYVRHRMTGFGGASRRPMMRDLTIYPSFLEFLMRATAERDQVSLLSTPAAVGEG